MTYSFFDGTEGQLKPGKLQLYCFIFKNFFRPFIRLGTYFPGIVKNHATFENVLNRDSVHYLFFIFLPELRGSHPGDIFECPVKSTFRVITHFIGNIDN